MTLMTRIMMPIMMMAMVKTEQHSSVQCSVHKCALAAWLVTLMHIIAHCTHCTVH